MPLHVVSNMCIKKLCVMVFRDIDFEEEFYGVKGYFHLVFGGLRYNIWIFRCGSFVNKIGGDSSDYWSMYSKCFKKTDNRVDFYSNNCANAKYNRTC